MAYNDSFVCYQSNLHDSNNLKCSRSHWSTCGYGLLEQLTIFGFVFTWIILGGYHLINERFSNASSRSVMFLHDPITQGMAIASLRNYHQKQSIIFSRRFLTLFAMWLEWPAFTFMPLLIFSKTSGKSSWISHLELSLHGIAEFVEFLIATLAVIFFLVSGIMEKRNRCTRWNYSRCLSTLVYEVMFLILIAGVIRFSTCTNGADELEWIPCQCIDVYIPTSVSGYIIFLYFFNGALKYTTSLQSKSHSLNFRFQPSFQITMVMARSFNPIISLILTMVMSRVKHSIVAVFFIGFYLLVVLYLMIYNYIFQPCIGHGLLPNNIRALTFSSSLYVSIIMFILSTIRAIELEKDPLYEEKYYQVLLCILVLPIVWVAAWLINRSRAIKYHIPRLSIPMLLSHSRPHVRFVGVIAATHANGSNFNGEETNAIYTKILDVVNNPMEDLLCTIHAIRLLYLCHWVKFYESKCQMNEQLLSNINNPEDSIILDNLWFPNEWNDHVASINGTSKISREEATGIIKTELNVKENQSFYESILRFSSLSLASSMQSKERLSSFVTPPVRGMDSMMKNRLSMSNLFEEKTVSTTKVSFLYQDIFNKCVNIRFNPRATDQVVWESSRLLFELYLSQRFKFQKSIYVSSLCGLCSLKAPVLMMDAIRTLHKVIIELETISPKILLYNSMNLSHLCSIVKLELSPMSVKQGLNLIINGLKTIDVGMGIKVHTIFSEKSLSLLFNALNEWQDNYEVSICLEDLLKKLKLIIQEHQKNGQTNDVRNNSRQPEFVEKMDWLRRFSFAFYGSRRGRNVSSMDIEKEKNIIPIHISELLQFRSRTRLKLKKCLNDIFLVENKDKLKFLLETVLELKQTQNCALDQYLETILSEKEYKVLHNMIIKYQMNNMGLLSEEGLHERKTIVKPTSKQDETNVKQSN